MSTQRENFLAAMVALVCWLSVCGTAVTAEPKWESLLPAIDVAQAAVRGDWKKTNETLSVGAAEGARLSLPVVPQGEYDIRVSFTRKTGRHSIGVVVVQGGRQVAFEVDAWGSHLAGFQNIGGRSIRDNSTRRENVSLENDKRYTMLVEVRKDQIRGLLDGKEVATHRTDGSDLSLPELWSLPNRRQLALVAWDSETVFHAVELRTLSGESVSVAKSNPPAEASKKGSRSTRETASTPNVISPGNAATARGQRVLIVIANQDFFYREYGEPRQELERAGIRVTVAAGRKSACRPHGGSGQGADGGIVQPDLALSNVKASDYDAVLFSGGWGASAYQYAFTGRYNNPAYNGDRAIKAEVNRIINEFVSQDKFVCALCNGVSVLAWARVKGKSPLEGKRVCAPTREAAAGIYDGRPAQPSCRWHPEANGAILSPAGSIGRPGTAEDDVLVDGKIITGEDDPSAREMGRRIVEVLSK